MMKILNPLVFRAQPYIDQLFLGIARESNCINEAREENVLVRAIWEIMHILNLISFQNKV